MTIDQRLAKLERENQIINGAGAVLLLALGACLLLGGRQDTPKVVEDVRAKRIVIVDDEGKARITLSSSSEQPSLSLFDKDGKARMRLSLGQGMPDIRLFDKSGKKGAGIAVTDLAGPQIYFADRAGKSRAVMGYRRTEPGAIGYPFLHLYDEDGKVVYKAPK